MEVFYRWVASHHDGVYRSLYLSILVLIVALAKYMEISIFFLIPPAIMALWLLERGIFQCSAQLLKKPYQIMMEQCDPFPFLREMQRQITYPVPDWSNTITRINLSVALRHAGSWQDALDVLKAIPIEAPRAAVLSIKGLYYSNLADVLQLLQEDTGAEEARQRFFALAAADGRSTVAREFPDLIPLNEAEQLYRRGEYRAALFKAGTVQPKNSLERVESAFFRGKCAAAMGDRDTAQRELNYVLQHGNKLAVIGLARALLAQKECDCVTEHF